LSDPQGAYWQFDGVYEAALVPVVSYLTHLINTDVIKKTYMEIAYDLLASYSD
jgi:hypothetical protein